jgi:hypothetical protein
VSWNNRLSLCFWVLPCVGMGCQTTAPPQPVVRTVADARQRADAYVGAHQLNWGEACFVMPQNGGYYVEYGDAVAHHGLTVDSDGTVEP